MIVDVINLRRSYKVQDHIKKSSLFSTFFHESLKRHKSCDFGDLSAHEIEINLYELQNGSRIFSSYNLPDCYKIDSESRLWIITDKIGSSTNVMFPSEYIDWIPE